MRYRLGAFVLLLALVSSVLAVPGTRDEKVVAVSGPPVSVSRVSDAEARAIHVAHHEITRSLVRHAAHKAWEKEQARKRAAAAAEKRRKARAAAAAAAAARRRHAVHRVTYASASPGSAKSYALSRIGSAQYSCLLALWNKESGWNTYATNSSSGAYGIPQALPGSKMASAGSDWRTNPITQVRWGLGYISAVYGSACNALAHSNSVGWY